MHKEWTREKLQKLALKVFRKHGKITQRLIVKEGRLTGRTIRKFFNSISELRQSVSDYIADNSLTQGNTTVRVSKETFPKPGRRKWTYEEAKRAFHFLMKKYPDKIITKKIMLNEKLQYLVRAQVYKTLGFSSITAMIKHFTGKSNTPKNSYKKLEVVMQILQGHAKNGVIRLTDLPHKLLESLRNGIMDHLGNVIYLDDVLSALNLVTPYAKKGSLQDFDAAREVYWRYRRKMKGPISSSAALELTNLRTVLSNVYSGLFPNAKTWEEFVIACGDHYPPYDNMPYHWEKYVENVLGLYAKKHRLNLIKHKLYREPDTGNRLRPDFILQTDDGKTVAIIDAKHSSYCGTVKSTVKKYQTLSGALGCEIWIFHLQGKERTDMNARFYGIEKIKQIVKGPSLWRAEEES